MTREKVLVCILSETRAHEITWKSFKEYVLDQLKADLALCISVQHDYDFSNPFWQFSRFRFPFREYDDWGSAYDECYHQLSQFMQESNRQDWRTLLTVKDQWLGGIKGKEAQPGSAGILLYARWHLLQQLYEQDLHLKYDRFVITRSDFLWTSPHPPMELLDPEMIWIPDGEGYGGITDRHVVLSADCLDCYLSCLRLMLTTPDDLVASMSSHTQWNLEKFLFHHLAFHGKQDSIRYFPYVMYSIRQWGGRTRWSKGYWSDEHGYYIKYPNEFSSASCTQYIIDSPKVWPFILREESTIHAFDAYLTSHDGFFLRKRDDKLVSDRTIRPSATSQLLSIDIHGDQGTIYLSSRLNGIFIRKRIDTVDIARHDSDSIVLYSKSKEAIYQINSSGELILVNTPDACHTSFRIRNRYTSGTHLKTQPRL